MSGDVVELPEAGPVPAKIDLPAIQAALGKALALELSMSQHSRAFSEKARLSSASRERRQEMAVIGESYRLVASMVRELRETVEDAFLAGGIDLVRQTVTPAEPPAPSQPESDRSSSPAASAGSVAAA